MSAGKKIHVWHVAYALRFGEKWIPHVAVFRDPVEAAAAAKVRDGDQNYACVVTSGPHEQSVPS